MPQALKVMVVPTIISQIIVLIYNMADTFYVGRTNDPYMVAGVSLILPVFNILICLAGLAGTGGGTLISPAVGRREGDGGPKGQLVFHLYFHWDGAVLFGDHGPVYGSDP